VPPPAISLSMIAGPFLTVARAPCNPRRESNMWLYVKYVCL